MNPSPSASRSPRLSRRTLLRGAGVTLALPWLEALAGPRPGAGPGRNLVYLYVPNGISRGFWDPVETGPDGELRKLSPVMRALEPWKKQLLIPRRLWTPRGNGHGSGTATWLTGGAFDERRLDAGRRSADIEAARHLGRDDLLPSLQLSTRGEGFFSQSLGRNNMSWTAAGLPAARLHEPRAVFDKMFSDPGDSWAGRSVLDHVLGQAKDLRRQVSGDDQRKVDEYFAVVRSVERRLDFAARDSAERAADRDLTDTLERPAPGIPAKHGEYVRLMLDLQVLALWSGATHVTSFMLDHGQSNRYFNFIDGVKGTWHALSHYRDASGRTDDDDGVTKWSSVMSKKQMFDRVTAWHMEQLAYLLKRMDGLRDANGSLLDRSTILYGSSISDGHAHSAKDLPLILAGGGWRTGMEHRFARDTSLSRLHLTMLQQAGIPLGKFADADAPLPELLA